MILETIKFKKLCIILFICSYLLSCNLEIEDLLSSITGDDSSQEDENTSDPVFSITSGAYDDYQTIVLTCNTEGALIYYTIDGSVPTADSELYSDSILVSDSQTVKAIAIKSGMNSSEIVVEEYSITRLSPPIISPESGELYQEQYITITCEDEEAIIYYTLDGVEPTTSSIIYTDAILVSSDITIRAIAVDSDLIISGSTTIAYEMKVITPTVNAESGTYRDVQGIFIYCDVDDVELYYTLDGTTPSARSIGYNSGESIVINRSQTLNVIGIKEGWRNSDIVEFEYDIQIPVVNYSIAEDVYWRPQELQLSCADPIADIYYTLDGTDPDASSILYTGTIDIAESTTVKAVALGSEWIESTIGEKTISIGKFTTLAGFDEPGFIDGFGSEAMFNGIRSITLDEDGNLYIVDSNNYAVRKMTPDGTVTSLIGGNGRGYTDGYYANAQLFNPSTAIYRDDKLYIADCFGIRILDADGYITTFVGSSESGYADGTGTEARFKTISAMEFDSNGNIIVVSGAPRGYIGIRKITPEGVVTTIAGNPEVYVGQGWDPIDGTGQDARFYSIADMMLDEMDNIYVIDSKASYSHGAQLIRKITPNGVVTSYDPTNIGVYPLAGMGGSITDMYYCGGSPSGYNTIRHFYREGDTYVSEVIKHQSRLYADIVDGDCGVNSRIQLAVDMTVRPDGFIYYIDYSCVRLISW